MTAPHPGQIIREEDWPLMIRVIGAQDWFARQLAEAERRGAEKALRDAASWVSSDPGRHSGAGIAEWLNHRADAIARGEQP